MSTATVAATRRVRVVGLGFDQPVEVASDATGLTVAQQAAQAAQATLPAGVKLIAGGVIQDPSAPLDPAAQVLTVVPNAQNG